MQGGRGVEVGKQHRDLHTKGAVFNFIFLFPTKPPFSLCLRAVSYSTKGIRVLTGDDGLSERVVSTL